MDAFKFIAEQKIAEAIEKGELDGLPGMGKPLHLEDETWIPEDLRITFRVLRNSGYIPPEIELKKEIMNLRNLIETLDDNEDRLQKIRKLNFMIMKLNTIRNRPLNFNENPFDENKILERVAGS